MKTLKKKKENADWLEECFFYSVFELYPSAYKADMNREVFTQTLDEFREKMNDQNETGFPPMSQAFIRRVFKAYKKRLGERLYAQYIRPM